ncbi:MAG: glycoside hydrolase family 2 protein [Opitutaceae bacterium]|nr:glycoside hydrolase family 2 protein [Opitutaceae bacterium]
MKPQALARLALLGCTLVAAPLVAASSPLAWPDVNSETRPWSRWWWLGNITTEADLRALMSEYAAAGLGGLEVTPIYGVRGYEEQFIPFLSPTFVDRLEFAAAEAHRHGMQIDMSTGTGWPFGGPWVDDATAARYLASRTFVVPAGGRLGEPVALEQKTFLRFAGAKQVPLETLKQPVTANENLQDLAIDQVRFPRALPLHTLMAFPRNAAGEGVDLTARVGSDGMLDWTAPAGGDAWTLHAIFGGFHGKMVERAGPGGEGMAIDHFSSAALARYLAPFDAALKGRRMEGFRGWFNDSYEVDDASGESNFTAAFFDEFQKRRGYDLRQQLPLLLDPNSGDAGDRLVCDYRETISDLLLEEFTKPWHAWAAAQGRIMRNQAHGSPANIIDLYAASDIPETEGPDVVQFKTASSAAHLTGKRLASAEALTWLDEHWLSSLGDARRAVDGFFLGGINHICYHGTVYSPPADPWPGFHFYAAVEFDPSNPLWAHFPALNAYVTRAQSFLQRGRPDEGVLLYYNIHDRWSQRGTGVMPHFHGGVRDGVTARAVGEQLLQAGYGFDYVTDRLLRDVRVERGMLVAGESTYAALVVPKTQVMPLETMVRLLDLADAGAKVVFEDAYPRGVAGGADLAKRQAAFRQLVEVRAPASGVRIAANVRQALGALPQVVREPMVDRGLRFVRRRDGSDVVYFIVNLSGARIDDWIPLGARPASAALFDPMTGAAGLAQLRSTVDGATDVRLQLEPGASILVRGFADVRSGAPWVYWRPAGSARELAGPWSLSFTAGGPELPAAVELATLRSWTETGGAGVRAFSGTARYVREFARPEGGAAAYALDLGRVAVSARVVLNGRDLGVLFDAPYRLIVPAAELAERNTLVIEVVNLGANRIADLDRRGVPWKKFYNVNMPPWRRENRGPDGLFSAAAWEPRESGLLGPVTLTPMPED